MSTYLPSSCFWFDRKAKIRTFRGGTIPVRIHSHVKWHSEFPCVMIGKTFMAFRLYNNMRLIASIMGHTEGTKVFLCGAKSITHILSHANFLQKCRYFQSQITRWVLSEVLLGNKKSSNHILHTKKWTKQYFDMR